jgi:peroxiredoxin
MILSTAKSITTTRLTTIISKVLILSLAVLCLVMFASASQAKLEKGEAPNFTLKSLRGDNIKLSEHRGEVVMLNFWATWCDRCKSSFPVLNNIYLKYRDKGFTLLSINNESSLKKVRKWLRGKKIAYPILLDRSHAVSDKYDVSDMPSTYILDRDGQLRFVHNGFEEGYEDDILKQVRELMEE